MKASLDGLARQVDVPIEQDGALTCLWPGICRAAPSTSVVLASRPTQVRLFGGGAHLAPETKALNVRQPRLRSLGHSFGDSE
jgi:hypothetical protein